MKLIYNNQGAYYGRNMGRWLWDAGKPGLNLTEPMYFDFSNTEGTGREVNISPKDYNINFEYSFDRVNWTSWRRGNNIVVDGHNKVWLRGNNNALGKSSGNQTKFTPIASSVNVAVGGNIMSLLYGGNFTGKETTFPTTGGYEFQGLFTDCQYLRDASGLILPALTLNAHCYHDMFLRTSLVIAPTILPATKLAQYCYTSMFNTCSNLETAPILPAEHLVNNCYQYMFWGVKITYIKCLATNPSTSYSGSWFAAVYTTGTFVKKAGTSWPTGQSGIPSGWTVVEE